MQFDRCAYKHALGVPGEGFHRHIGGVALLDFIGTAVIAGVISALTGWSFWFLFIALFILGEFLHWYFCVDTVVIKYIKNGYRQAVSALRPVGT